MPKTPSQRQIQLPPVRQLRNEGGAIASRDQSSYDLHELGALKQPPRAGFAHNGQAQKEDSSCPQPSGKRRSPGTR